MAATDGLPSLGNPPLIDVRVEEDVKVRFAVVLSPALVQFQNRDITNLLAAFLVFPEQIDPELCEGALDIPDRIFVFRQSLGI